MVNNFFYKANELGNFNEKEPTAILNVLNYLGNIVALVFFCTPLLQIVNVYKKKLDIKSVPLFLLLMILFNCLFWLLNAFSSNNYLDWLPLLISNITGLVVNLTILFLYLYIFLNRKVKQFCFYGLFVVDLLAEITYIMFRFVIIPTKGESNTFYLIGLIATIINVLMYLSPTQNLYKLIKEKKSANLPIFTLAVGFVATLVFLIKGIIEYNYYETDEKKRNARDTMVSNGVSFGVICLQIGFWMYYFLREKKNLNTDTYTEENEGKEKEEKTA